MGRSRSWWRQLQLKNVEHIRATSSAFAAILQDGSVVAWGDRSAGGDSSRVQDQLKNVEHIQATSKAFAAILQDGSVIAWGDPQAGGRTCHRARNVQQVHFQMAPLWHGAIQCLATWTKKSPSWWVGKACVSVAHRLCVSPFDAWGCLGENRISAWLCFLLEWIPGHDCAFKHVFWVSSLVKGTLVLFHLLLWFLVYIHHVWQAKIHPWFFNVPSSHPGKDDPKHGKTLPSQPWGRPKILATP